MKHIFDKEGARLKSVCSVLLWAMLLTVCTDTTVGTPELIHPINGEQVAVPFTFVWSSVDNSIGYRFDVRPSHLTYPILWVDVTDTTYTVNQASSGMYYWRVAAYGKNDQLGEFACPDSFEIFDTTSLPKTEIKWRKK